jgi:N-acetylneuraminic acid mutarotase
VYAHTWAYDPETDTWAERLPMRTPRHGLAGTALDGHIYAIGGNTAAGIGAATSSVVKILTSAEN